MNDKIEDSIKSINASNKEWFYRFFEMLEKCDVDQETIDKALNLILKEGILYYKSTMGIGSVFTNSIDSKRDIESFFLYCENLIQEKGKEEFKSFFQRIIDNVCIVFDEKFKDKEKRKRVNIYYLIMREFVLNNPEKVKMVSTGTIKDGSISIYFEGIAIGHITYEEIKANMKVIEFDDFRTMPGLEKIGLGTYLFTEFCKKVAEDADDYAVIAWGVMKGRDGEKAYSAWGGFPVCPQVDGEVTQITEKPLTEEEYAAAPTSIHYLFTRDVVVENSKRESKRYGIQDVNQTNYGEDR